MQVDAARKLPAPVGANLILTWYITPHHPDASLRQILSLAVANEAPRRAEIRGEKRAL